ncbi:MAG: carbon starvation protein A [Gemmatimonadetes bacterium]|jgi:carbon starvation protein|nr:carbon starvation protein A [Gemmatimonadota bacterium]HIN52647.1 carbon starvation protein A [Gemmatimonadota bacterium]|tara:strand:+ start:2178 stop:3848 length:1671 start_codon:yes stop_codon:yes gene_type:complete
MPAIVPALIGITLIALGYFFYSKFIAEKIYQLDPEFETPAHALRDDIDFIPTNRVVLWGHHFTAVAGAAPIIGPAIAVIWGWLPAFIWVIAGTIFFAGVHDFGAVWASVRNEGRSIGSLTGDVVSHRARTLFLIVIFFLLMMVNAVFAVSISNAFVATPSSVIPAWSAIAVALVIGVLIYRMGVPILWPTIIGTIILYAVIYLGDQVPVSLPETFMGLGAAPQWIIILFVYATIASLLPVWLLLQPRDYINGIQLIIGLGLLFGAVFAANPDIVAPMYNTAVPEGTPPLLPLLFVTIACGALSGFHGLVASGTTSKQLDKETDARFVGYLGSSGEGLLALVTILAVSAGFASLGEWQTTYAEFGLTGIPTFVEGGSQIVSDGTPLSKEFAATLLAVMAVLFAGTTMDAGVRLQRYIIQEWGTIYKIPVLQNGYIATFGAVAACLALAFGAGGRSGQGGMAIWPLFGTTNQLLAGLTLLVLSVMLVKLKRRYIFTMVPMVFVTTMSFFAALYQLWDLFNSGSYFLMALDLVVIVLAIFVILESGSAFTREKRAAEAS